MKGRVARLIHTVSSKLIFRKEPNFSDTGWWCSKVLQNLTSVVEQVNETSLNNERKVESIKSKIFQSLGLMEILSAKGAIYSTEMKLARELLEQCLSRIKISSIPSVRNKPTNVIQEEFNSQTHEECSFNKYKQDPAVAFSDVIGCEKAKQSLRENIVFHLSLPNQFLRATFTGIRTGSGNVLLHGPPGTGKTLLAQAAAKEAGADFIPIKPSDILSKYHGESEKFLSNIFDYIKSLENAVLFIDEIDSIATSRISMQDNIQSRRILSELLLQLSNFRKEERTHKRDIQGEEKPLTRVGIIAATNRIEDIDEAVVRRFECKIYVGVPRKDDRKQLIVKYLTGCDFTLSDKELEHITTETYGWSGSDIEVLTREAAMVPIREITYNQLKNVIPVIRAITIKDFGKDMLLPLYGFDAFQSIDEAFKSVIIRNSEETIGVDN